MIQKKFHKIPKLSVNVIRCGFRSRSDSLPVELQLLRLAQLLEAGNEATLLVFPNHADTGIKGPLGKE